MEQTETKYTTELYNKFQICVNEIEKNFFLDKGKQKLPEIVMAINNKCSSCVTAYVQVNALYDKGTDKKIQYLAINPVHLNRASSEILATLCHELCHVYENAYIHVARGGYHDKQWAELMKSCGLEPVFNNKSKTSVSTKIIEGGEFEDYVKSFDEVHPDFFTLVEYSPEVEHATRVKLGLDEDDGVLGAEADNTPRADNADVPVKIYNRNKIKYVCSECGAKVWGKPGLSIVCGDCGLPFEEEEHEESN